MLRHVNEQHETYNLTMVNLKWMLFAVLQSNFRYLDCLRAESIVQ